MASEAAELYGNTYILEIMRSKSKVLILVLLSISTIIIDSCECFFSDEKLTIQRKDYSGDELKTGGYYTNNYYDYGTFLYRNGIVMKIPGKENNYAEDRFLDEDLIKHVKRYKDYWAVFEINNDNIIIQGWGPGDGSLTNGLPVITQYGKILNDTTFVLTKHEKGGKTTDINHVYSFHEFSPKPDSTNHFIK